MIYITGDTHGLIDFEKLHYFDKGYFTKKDVLIILGDAGIVWNKETLNQNISKYSLLGLTIIYIDGNHENFHLLECFPIVSKFGARMHYLGNNIYHVLRGEIMLINNLSFLCIGGAISIDKQYRKLGISYWPEEEILNEDIDNAILNLKKFKNKVDYVLTHCCDSGTVSYEFGYRPDICTDKLNFIDKVVDYKYWYFGHYHKDLVINDNKRCFYNDILEIREEYKGNDIRNYNSYYYFEEDYRKGEFVNNLPYLYSGFKYNSKIVKEDLPEWYVYGRYYKRWGYISSKGIVNIKYEPNMWTNHYLKDDYLNLTYDNERKMSISGPYIIHLVYAIEKYNDIDLTYLKKMINYKARFYNEYHKDDEYDEKVEKAFKEIPDDLDIENVIENLIDKVKEEKDILAETARRVMHSKVASKIFKKETGFYLKSVEELYSLLIEEDYK